LQRPEPDQSPETVADRGRRAEDVEPDIDDDAADLAEADALEEADDLEPDDEAALEDTIVAPPSARSHPPRAPA
jgi:hypothetical protein